jgi:hypothetical protein
MPAEIAVTPETPGRGVGPTVAAGSPDDNRPCFRLAYCTGRSGRLEGA